jgi:hypothetical protein
MDIKVCRIEDGPARVEVVNPESGETSTCIDLNVGEEITLTIPGASEPTDIVAGEVCKTGEAAGTGEGSGSAGEGEEPPGGEGGDAS